MGFLQIPGVSVHKELAGHFWFWANEASTPAPWQQLCLITFISFPKEHTSLKFCHRASPQGASGSSAEYVLLITHLRNWNTLGPAAPVAPPQPRARAKALPQTFLLPPVWMHTLESKPTPSFPTLLCPAKHSRIPEASKQTATTQKANTLRGKCC